MGTVRVASAQFFSGDDVEQNLVTAVGFIRRAAEAGADLVVLPENANRVRDYPDRETCWELAERPDGPFVRGIVAAAAAHRVFVAVGVDIAGPQRPDVAIASLLIDRAGGVVARVDKHVLWDYEYTLFVPGTEPFRVVDTELGRLGLLLCADGIVPETPRMLALLGAQVLVNSLNSRGPDEVRVHVPLRAMENRVWHVSANTVGGPVGEFPWMGGSQVVAPDGRRLVVASETEEDLILADIRPAEADDKHRPGLGDVMGGRRPDLYADLVAPIETVPAAAMYGPAGEDAPSGTVRAGLLQVSFQRSEEFTARRVAAQIAWAGRQGVTLAVLPERFAEPSLWSEVPADAEHSLRMLEVVRRSAREAEVHVAGSFVEHADGRRHHTAFLIGPDGSTIGAYRKTHLNEAERRWADAGDDLVVLDTAIGRIGLLIGDEIWVPEVARILALRGAEVVVHPCAWRTVEEATLAATERTEENRFHLVSCARLDNLAGFGSQIVRADEFQGGEPIALMRYPTAYWTRPGFEEQLAIDLPLREANSKMMGHHLDVLATRQPALYGAMVDGGPANAGRMA